MGKLVYGVGINDADYQVCSYEKVEGKYKLQWICPFYSKWLNMLQRCYIKSETRDTYKDCYTVPEWHYFMTFRAWMVEQDWEGKQLDKDILFPGNKVYGPDTCVFVDQMVNLFMSDKLNTDRELPTGVYKDRNGKRFTAHCHSTENQKQQRLGTFDTPEEAYAAWLLEKIKNAKFLASQQKDPRVAKAILEKYKNR